MAQVLRLVISHSEGQHTFDVPADASRNASVLHEALNCSEFEGLLENPRFVDEHGCAGVNLPSSEIMANLDEPHMALKVLNMSGESGMRSVLIEFRDELRNAIRNGFTPNRHEGFSVSACFIQQ